MNYNFDINDNYLNNYLDRMINKTFAILGIYEDCSKTNNFDNYYVYINRLCTEIKGCEYSLEYSDFFTLYNILIGMHELDSLTHSEIKSLVFYSISLIKKMKVIK